MSIRLSINTLATLASLLCTLFLLGACTTSAHTANSEGEQLFEDNCQQCHRDPGGLKEPQSFLSKTIHTGGEKMPSFDGTLSAEEEKLLLEYLSSN